MTHRFTGYDCGPLHLKWFSRSSWFLWFKNIFLASYYAKRTQGQPRFKAVIGKLHIEWY